MAFLYTSKVLLTSNSPTARYSLAKPLKQQRLTALRKKTHTQSPVTLHRCYPRVNKKLKTIQFFPELECSSCLRTNSNFQTNGSLIFKRSTTQDKYQGEGQTSINHRDVYRRKSSLRAYPWDNGIMEFTPGRGRKDTHPHVYGRTYLVVICHSMIRPNILIMVLSSNVVMLMVLK